MKLSEKKRALRDALKAEWSMGNGQCHSCEGSQPGRGWWTACVGHHRNCSTARIIRVLGGKPVMLKVNPDRQPWGLPDCGEEAAVWRRAGVGLPPFKVTGPDRIFALLWDSWTKERAPA